MSTTRSDLPLVYRWRPKPPIGALRCPDLKGRACRIIARGAMNSRLVECDDGSRYIVSGNALRKQ